jgi:hypothetical protein
MPYCTKTVVVVVVVAIGQLIGVDGCVDVDDDAMAALSSLRDYQIKNY